MNINRVTILRGGMTALLGLAMAMMISPARAAWAAEDAFAFEEGKGLEVSIAKEASYPKAFDLLQRETRGCHPDTGIDLHVNTMFCGRI